MRGKVPFQSQKEHCTESEETTVPLPAQGECPRDSESQSPQHLEGVVCSPLQSEAPLGQSAQLWVTCDKDNEVPGVGPLNSRGWTTSPTSLGLDTAGRGTCQELGFDMGQRVSAEWGGKEEAMEQRCWMARDCRGTEIKGVFKFSHQMVCAKPLYCTAEKRPVKRAEPRTAQLGPGGSERVSGPKQHSQHGTAVSALQRDSGTPLKMTVSKVNLHLKPLVQRFWVHSGA